MTKMSHEDSSSDDGGAFTFTARRFNSNKRQSQAVDASSSDDDDDDDDDDFKTSSRRNKKKLVQNQINQAKSKTITSPAKATGSLRQKSSVLSDNNPVVSISLLESSDDDDEVDAADTYVHPVETDAMRKAKLARIKLMASAAVVDVINLDDSVDDDGYEPMVVGHGSSLTQSGRVFENVDLQKDLDGAENCILLDDDSDTNVLENQNAAGNGTRIKLKLRINSKDPDIEAFSIIVTDPFYKLFDAFSRKIGIALSRVKFFLDGDELNPNSNCQNEDLEGGEIIDVTVSGEFIRKPVSVSQVKILQSKRIKLRLRVNGNDSDLHLFQLVATDPFQKLMDAFCKKVKKSVTSVQFELDGDKLNECSTCQNEDLEGGEIIDVKM